METIVQIFETPAETAHAVAKLLVENIKQKAKNREFFNVALSGGSTPKLLFHIIATDYANSIPWDFVRFFWVDERCVPPTNPESNFGMTYESLLKHTPVPETNIFRMQGENEPETEAQRYEKLLLKELPFENNFPQFDLILLGMGDDGHTASIFPNNMGLLHSERLVDVAAHPATGQKRITLTGKTICNAKQLIFLITGESKSEILRQIINKEQSSFAFPAAHIHNVSNNINFFIDKKAATQL
jgi:6-phosphogluconolactonase